MIGKLTGVADEKLDDTTILLDVAGVGYRVLCAHAENITIGDNLTLWIETQMSEHALTLYGFRQKVELEWFKLLLSVHGVGNRAALALLAAFSCAELAELIARGDGAALSKAQGVGKKLAERLTNELKNKMPQNPIQKDNGNESGNVVSLPVSGHQGNMSISGGAISALVNLGYPENIARQTVGRVLNANESQPLEATIKTCLKELAR